MKKFLLVIWNDVEPEVLGPYDDEEQREKRARQVREKRGDAHGIYWLSAECTGRPDVSAFCASFFGSDCRR